MVESKTVSAILIVLGFLFIIIVVFTPVTDFLRTFGVIFGVAVIIVGYMIRGNLRKVFESEDVYSEEITYE